MYKLLMIARNNIKRQKGDMITFFVLTLFAAFLIFDSASAILGVGRVLDDWYGKTNSPEVILITGDSAEERECIREAFTENTHIADFEATPALLARSWRYRNTKDVDWDEYEFLVESADVDKRMMVHDPENTRLAENEICLPLYLKGSFPIGDTMQIGIGEDIYDFRVAGYMEDPYFCSSLNITIYYVYMAQERIDALMKDHPELEKCRSLIHKGKINDMSGISTIDMEKEITDRYKALIAPYGERNPERDYLGYLSVSWENMKGGASFLSMIVCAIVMLFAVIIIAVAAIIITFSIRNFIRRSMKDTGALEASGYTVRELRGALTVQIALAALTGSLAGILLGIATFGIFGQVVTIVLGLTWNQPLNIPVAVITVLALTGLMILEARWVSRAFKKFTVLDALRGGINAHNYRKNHVRLEKTKLPVSAALSMKDTLGNPGRNIVLAAVACILTLAMLMGFGMYENFGKNTARMAKLLGFETAEIAVDGDRDLGDELRKMEGVASVLGSYGFEPTYISGSKEQTQYTYAVDDMANTINTIIIEGRGPQHENEIMLTAALARDLGVRVGDVVTVKFGSRSAEYLITGTNQRMERMGRTGYMTFAGAERIIPNLNEVHYYVTGEKNVTYDDLKLKIDALAKGKGTSFQTTDVWKNVNNSMGAMAEAMKALCIGIAIITILVVIFVEALIIRAKIIREWRGMGISKAMGATSRELIIQIMLSNMPAIAIGVLAGIALSPWAGSRLTIAILSIFGIEKLPFHIPAGYMAFTGVAILAVALATAGLLGLKVRKINPVQMITEE